MPNIFSHFIPLWYTTYLIQQMSFSVPLVIQRSSWLIAWNSLFSLGGSLIIIIYFYFDTGYSNVFPMVLGAFCERYFMYSALLSQETDIQRCVIVNILCFCFQMTDFAMMLWPSINITTTCISITGSKHFVF